MVSMANHESGEKSTTKPKIHAEDYFKTYSSRESEATRWSILEAQMQQLDK
jgi:hypothetical protein